MYVSQQRGEGAAAPLTRVTVSGPEETGRASHKNAVTAEEILLLQEGGDAKRFRLTHGCKQDPGVRALLCFLYSERCKGDVPARRKNLLLHVLHCNSFQENTE